MTLSIYSTVDFVPEKPNSTTPQGWWGTQLEYRHFTPPLAVAEQQFSSFQPEGKILIITPEGWQGIQLEYRHFTPPFPVAAQMFYAYDAELGNVPTAKTPHGWEGIQLETRFATPFPVTQQQWAAWEAQDVPLFFPPGAGKRYAPPTNYLPEPAYDERPRKPIRPIWDRGGKVEKAAENPAENPAGPPPLPPLSVLGLPPAAPMSTANLPRFDQYVPHDVLETARRLEQAREHADAIAALKALGLISEE